MQISPAYRQQIINVLIARGLPPTEENIQRVANAKPKGPPSGPSTGEQIAMGVGGAAATAAGYHYGPQLAQAAQEALGLGGGAAATNTAVQGTNAAVQGTNLGVQGANAAVQGTNAAIQGTNAAVQGTNAAVQGTNLGAQAVNQSVMSAAQQGTMYGAGAAGASAAGAAGAGAGATGTGTGIVVQGSLGSGTGAGAGAGAGAAGSGLGSSALSTGLSIAGGIAGAYGLYDTVDSSYKRQQRGGDLALTAASGAMSGAAIGSVIPGVGTAVGALIGGLIGLGSGYIGSEKDAHQMTRDYSRDRMVDLGIYEHTPATAERYSMGGDGGYRLADGRRGYEIIQGQAEGMPVRDYTAEEGQLVGALNPLSMVIAGGGDTEDNKIKAAGNTVGMLYNDLMQNDGSIDINEVRDLYAKAGADQGSMFRALDLMRQGGAISEEQHLAANNALNEIYGQEYYAEKQSQENLAVSDMMARRLLGMNDQ